MRGGLYFIISFTFFLIFFFHRKPEQDDVKKIDLHNFFVEEALTYVQDELIKIRSSPLREFNSCLILFVVNFKL